MSFPPPFPPKLILEIRTHKIDPFLEKAIAKYGSIGGDLTNDISKNIKTSEEKDINSFKEDIGSYYFLKQLVFL